MKDHMNAQVLGSLEGLGAQPVWGAPGGEGGGAGGGAGGPLPAFSAYPQQAVTAAGEYLMMLPQTLEGLLGGDSEAEEEAVDAEWLDRVRWQLTPQETFKDCKLTQQVKLFDVSHSPCERDCAYFCPGRKWALFASMEFASCAELPLFIFTCSWLQ